MNTLTKTLAVIFTFLFIIGISPVLKACSNEACSNHFNQVVNAQTTFLARDFEIKEVLNIPKWAETTGEMSLFHGISEGIREYRLRTIVLDAGHGGKDAGCLGKDSKEKLLTLEYVLALGAKIEAAFPDIKVVYTRKTDIFVELHERANIANKNKADLFISIHCNWNPNTSPYGTETYVLGLHRAKENLEVAKRENSSIFFENDYERNYDGFDPNSPEGNILMAMSQNAHLDQSISIAEKIEHEFAVTSGRKSRGVRQAGFLVLRRTTMPAILIETGFLSNAKEEIYMTTSKGKKAIVQNIFDGFVKYKNTVEFRFEDIADKPLANNSSPAVDENATASIESGVIAVSNSRPIASATIKTESIEKPALKYGSGTEICVQLLVTTRIQDMEDAKWSRFENIIAREENNVLKYQVICTSLQEAGQVRNIARSNGFPEAFIVAYKDGQRIALDAIESDHGAIGSK